MPYFSLNVAGVLLLPVGPLSDASARARSSIPRSLVVQVSVLRVGSLSRGDSWASYSLPRSLAHALSCFVRLSAARKWMSSRQPHGMELVGRFSAREGGIICGAHPVGD